MEASERGRNPRGGENEQARRDHRGLRPDSAARLSNPELGVEKRPERKRPWFPVSTGDHPAREGARGRGGVRGVPRWTRWSQGSFGGLRAGAATSMCVRLRRPRQRAGRGKDQAGGARQGRPASEAGNKL